MAVVVGYEALKKLCDALGFGGRQIRSLKLVCAVDEAVTAVVEEYLTREQVEAYVAAAKAGTLTPGKTVIVPLPATEKLQ